MKIEFNVTVTERKALVIAIGEILEVRPKYLGMPTAAYKVDCFCIDKNGTVEFDEKVGSEKIDNLLEQLAKMGFVRAEQKANTSVLNETMTNNTSETETTSQNGNVGLTVAMPLESANINNLTKLLVAKGSLIKKALGVDELPVKTSEEKILFPWFSELDSDTTRAYTNFISAICKMSKEQKRITAKEKAVDNEKYAFRCFLLRLGFIGVEYKEERKILLRNLKGNSAFKSGAKKEADTDEISE